MRRKFGIRTTGSVVAIGAFMLFGLAIAVRPLSQGHFGESAPGVALVMVTGVALWRVLRQVLTRAERG